MVFSSLQAFPSTLLSLRASSAGFLLFGYDRGFFGGVALTNNNFLNLFGHTGQTLKGQIVALYGIGCILTCLLSIFVGDILGRRRAILVGSSVLIVEP